MYAIGEASRLSGVSIETIRYYEREGIVAKPARTGSGRRRYGPKDISRLTFIRRCRELGFPIPEIRALMALSEETGCSCDDVAGIGRRHLDSIRARIADLKRMERALEGLVASCADGSPRCAMLETLQTPPEPKGG